MPTHLQTEVANTPHRAVCCAALAALRLRRHRSTPHAHCFVAPGGGLLCAITARVPPILIVVWGAGWDPELLAQSRAAEASISSVGGLYASTEFRSFMMDK